MADVQDEPASMARVRSVPRIVSWSLVALCGVVLFAASVMVSLAVATDSGGPVMISNLVVFGLPVLGYALVRRHKGDSVVEIVAKLSLGRARPAYFVLAIVLSLVGAAGFHLVVKPVILPAILPPDVISGLGGAYAGLPPGPVTAGLVFASEALNVALGEELFFRGLVAGWAMRHFRPTRGNALQSVIFLLPHLAVLTASAGFWLLLPAVLVGGWSLGVLMRRSGSIWPGWLIHALGNTLIKMPL